MRGTKLSQGIPEFRSPSSCCVILVSTIDEIERNSIVEDTSGSRICMKGL